MDDHVQTAHLRLRYAVHNPFQMNDWEIGRLLGVTFILLASLWVLLGADYAGIHLPLVTQVVSLPLLLFVPGMLVLRSLRLRKLGNVLTLLYSLGLSIGVLMSIALVLNTVSASLGSGGLISTVPLMLSFSAVILFLSVVSYARDTKEKNYLTTDLHDVITVPALCLCLVPFFSIFGSYLMNIYANNFLSLLSILIIAIIVVVAAFLNRIPAHLYPLAVFVIAVSLVLNRALISNYVNGWDIQNDLFSAASVVKNQFLDQSIPERASTAVSISLFVPAFSYISGIDIINVFKVVLPVVYCFVPVGLYVVFQKQFNEKIAFLSTFFFMANFTFFIDLPSLPKQEIAELFMVLILLLLVSGTIQRRINTFFLILFSFLLVVSHYGLGYIFLFCLLLAWVILHAGKAFKRLKAPVLRKKRVARDGVKPRNATFETAIDRSLTTVFVLLFCVFLFAWTSYTASSTIFGLVVNQGHVISQTFFRDFLSPESAAGAAIVAREYASPLHYAELYLHLICQFLIVFGLLALLFTKKSSKVRDEFLALCVGAFILLVVTFVVPYFGTAFNASRLYHVSLFFLAPCAVVGAATIINSVNRFKLPWSQQVYRSSMKVIAILFVILLLFDTGFVYEVAKDHPNSYAFNSTLEDARYNDAEITSALWIGHAGVNTSINVDHYKVPLIAGIAPTQVKQLLYAYKVPRHAYVYLGTSNIASGQLYMLDQFSAAPIYTYVNASDVIANKTKIYDNGGSQIFFT